MSRRVVFQKLHVTNEDIIQFILFVCAFYAFESPLFYNRHNHEGDVTVIPSTMKTHQSDPLGRALFTLGFYIFTFNYFPSYLFLSIVNDTPSINPLSIISFTYEHLQTKLCAINGFIQLFKCVTWSPSSLLSNFNTPS